MKKLIILTAFLLCNLSFAEKTEDSSEVEIAKLNIMVISEGETNKSLIQKKLTQNPSLCKEYNESLKILKKENELIECIHRSNSSINNNLKKDPEKEMKELNRKMNLFSEYERKIIFYNSLNLN